MKLTIDGADTYLATGGQDFDASRPCVLFLHGSGMDHRAWVLQTRWFAYHGYSVVAPDFPAHSLSAGTACSTIEQSAQWLQQLLNALQLEQFHIVGHSQGFLSALELNRLVPDSVLSLTGVGTAHAIAVNPALIETAQADPSQAADMMLQWGFGSRIHRGASPIPGLQPMAAGRQTMSANPLAEDLRCCADYAAGEDALTHVRAPSLMILAEKDKMTPIKFGLETAKKLNAKTVVLNDYGHMLPIEAPKCVLNELRNFIQTI